MSCPPTITSGRFRDSNHGVVGEKRACTTYAVASTHPTIVTTVTTARATTSHPVQGGFSAGDAEIAEELRGSWVSVWTGISEVGLWGADTDSGENRHLFQKCTRESMRAGNRDPSGGDRCPTTGRSRLSAQRVWALATAPNYIFEAMARTCPLLGRNQRFFHRDHRLRSSHGFPWAAKILPLQNDICCKNREGQAGPNDRFDRAGAEFLPPGHPANHSHFQKNDRDREAARHPLAMQVHISPKDECQGDASGDHP